SMSPGTPMSTEDPTPAPRTRAEARAARAAAEAAKASVPESEAMVAEPDVSARAPEAQGPAATDVEPVPLAPEEDTLRLPPLNDSQPNAPVSTAPSGRRFIYTLLAVVGVLTIAVAGLGAVSLFQGPRVSQVQVDAAEAI